MVKSFRLRLTVATALLAGVALAGFASIAWWQMRSAKIDTLDRQILDQVERELSRPWPAEHWMRHEHNMGRAFGTRTIQQSLLLMQDSGGDVFRSEHWPEDLNPSALHWPSPQKRPTSAPPAIPRDVLDANPPPAEADRAGETEQPADAEPTDDTPPPPRNRPPRPFPPLFRDGQRPPFPPPDGFPPPYGDAPRHHPAFVTQIVDAGNRHWRFGLATSPLGNLAIGVDLEVVDAEMADLRNAYLLATPLTLGFIGLGAWFLSGRALSPIKRLTTTMQGLTAKGLDQRITLGREDQEFRQLIQVFNGMLERLERSFLQASRFAADAAHELKTPLAILQGQIEQAMAQCEAGSPVQSRLTDILDEVQRLATISRKLLLLSLADAGRLRLHVVRFDLSQALEDLVEDAQMLSPELDVSGSIASSLTVDVDPALLRQVLHNLLGNAIKYNLPNGWIRINAARQNDRVEVSVANASTGIPSADHERIFERFYRADPSHNRQIEGVGLGLSLSREIVRAHGGDLTLAKSAEGEVKFVVNLATQITTL